MIVITNEDNMQLMSRYPDGHFDLAIVDPPYGVLNKTSRGGDRKFNKEEYSKWDIKPDESYFNELFRISKNQPESLNNFSMAEMAWTSFDMPSKIFHFSVRKNRGKIHPTQKPVELYEWLLKMYAGPGDRILDTHLGSGTIAIACYNAGISLTACEISRTYYENAIAKISEYIPADLIDLRENECNIIQTPE